jgi:hypothetical protein
MKPTSLSRMAFIAIVCFFLSAFATRQSFSHAVAIAQNTHYYFYLTDDDNYDAYNTVSDEILHLQGMFGVPVNTNPFGGTLVAQGYLNNIYPHQIWPSSYLYAHF